MNQIKTYLDNLFSELPDTDDVNAMREHLKQHMEEEYSALLSEGKNEYEAFGRVIADFGSMDEIKKELNINTSTKNKREDILLSDAYKNAKKKSTIIIAFAVGLFIMSPVVFLAMDYIFHIEFLSCAVFLAFIACGVVLCIYAGSLTESYEEILEASANPEYKKTKKLSDTVSSIIMLCATLVFFILGFIFNAWHPGWVVFPIGGILCCISNAIFELKES